MDNTQHATPLLHFGRLLPLETCQRPWFAKVPAGTEPKTVFQPSYWKHFASQLREDDMVRVKCEDGSWTADLWVLCVSKVEVIFRIHHFVELDNAKLDPETGLHTVVWKGPQLRYCVIHRGTGAVIKDKLYPKSQAVAYLNEHLKMVE